MQAVMMPILYSEAKPACQGPCLGYGTSSSCPPLIVVAMKLALEKDRSCCRRRESIE
jgi:hypothetical protein